MHETIPCNPSQSSVLQDRAFCTFHSRLPTFECQLADLRPRVEEFGFICILPWGKYLGSSWGHSSLHLSYFLYPTS